MLVFFSRQFIGELRSLAGKSWIIMSTNQVPLEKKIQELNSSSRLLNRSHLKREAAAGQCRPLSSFFMGIDFVIL